MDRMSFISTPLRIRWTIPLNLIGPRPKIYKSSCLLAGLGSLLGTAEINLSSLDWLSLENIKFLQEQAKVKMFSLGLVKLERNENC